jgi:hypothetical protein
VQHSARGSDQVVQVPVREIERMAKAMVMERRDEFLAKARASSVVQDEIRRLQAREERKRQRQLERNLQHLHKPHFRRAKLMIEMEQSSTVWKERFVASFS